MKKLFLIGGMGAGKSFALSLLMQTIILLSATT